MFHSDSIIKITYHWKMSIKYKRQQINAKTKNKEILELSDKDFKEAVIKVFQRSITKTVEKNERKNKMTQQRKTK